MVTVANKPDLPELQYSNLTLQPTKFSERRLSPNPFGVSAGSSDAPEGDPEGPLGATSRSCSLPVCRTPRLKDLTYAPALHRPDCRYRRSA